MNKIKFNETSDNLTKVATAIFTIFGFFMFFIFRGIWRKKTWSKEALISWFIFFLAMVAVVYSPRWDLAAAFSLLSPQLALLIKEHFAPRFQLLVICLAPLSLWLCAMGVWAKLEHYKVQKAIEYLGLKTPNGRKPKVVSVCAFENGHSLITVNATGLDIADFKSKKGVLESGLNAIVQEIRPAIRNRQLFEILISEKELPTLVKFQELSPKLKEPYSFIVGVSFDKVIVVNLCDIYHLITAGATGTGKSIFFRQALVGILKSSRAIQLYLVDLKRGVDMRPFSQLSNVDVAKDNTQAVSFLRMLHKEMNRRFELMEQKQVNEINPSRDKLDRLVIAIDEASELFTVDKTTPAIKAQAEEARSLMDKLTKLGRAAGIHVILATQKVVKETIDTRVQTNVNGKICFRVNTVASSMTVLGNKRAAELPKTKGRAIWSMGSEDVIVQVPFLDGEEFEEEMESLKEKFNQSRPIIYQPMLTQNPNERLKGEAFVSDNEGVANKKEEVLS